MMLEGFQQRHEVPHSIDVVLHEQPKLVDVIDLAVKRMVQQRIPQWSEGFLELLDSAVPVHGSPFRVWLCLQAL